MALKPPRGWWPRCRRALYWTHRWLGIAGCLLFAMWFVSGLVMMYVGFPALHDEERLAGLQPLRVDQARVTPRQAFDALPAQARERPPRRVVLEMLAAGPQAGPVWRIVDADGRRHALSARDGRPLAATDAALAVAIARAFAGSGAGTARHAETLERDQWTVPQGLDPLRPLHRIELGDAAGTELYVSAVSGEVVRDTHRAERFWNWLGAVPHWIYFTPLRADPPLWREVLLWVSGACIVSAVTGLVIGILRLRLRGRYRNGRMTPYGGWLAWHHVAGLLGGLFVLSWMTSGWLSMDPNRWFRAGAAEPAAALRYEGGRPLDDLPWPPAAPADARELELAWFDGRPLLRWRDGQAAATVVDARSGEPPRLAREAIERAARRWQPAAPLQQLVWLSEADTHWYSHHRERPLPVWRAVLGDEAATWLHIDPASGRLLATSDHTSRLRRWLFNAAHSLDFPWLIAHRPAWDFVVWALSAAGLVVSISGVVIGWRRLRKPATTARRSVPPLAPLGDPR